MICRFMSGVGWGVSITSPAGELGGWAGEEGQLLAVCLRSITPTPSFVVTACFGISNMRPAHSADR